jgi:exoribonuclease R
VSALAALPREMAEGDRRSHSVDRAAIDATEAWLLTGQVGARFQATVVEASNDGASGVVALVDPPVRARCTGHDLRIGQRLAVRLVEANAGTRAVRFEAARTADGPG